MADRTRDVLLRQFDTAWKLTSFHLDGLTTEECLWRPSDTGPHVHNSAGAWRADWPEDEGYHMGPPSIAWITWHVCYWWSTVLDQAFGAGELTRERVEWPGDAGAVRRSLADLQARWVSAVGALDDDDLRSSERTRWPFVQRPFADVCAWVNIELTKNAAEVGYARFLYATRKGISSG